MWSPAWKFWLKGRNCRPKPLQHRPARPKPPAQQHPRKQRPRKAKAKKSAKSAAKSVGEPHPQYQPTEAELSEAVRHGQAVYAVQLRMGAELTDKNRLPRDVKKIICSIGHLLGVNLPDADNLDNAEACLDVAEPLIYTLATVLEEDLLAEALEVPQSQIERFVIEKTAPATPNPVEEKVAISAPETAPPAATEAQASPESPGAKPPAAKSGGEGVETVRVKVEVLNNLMNLAGEMVLLRNQLLRRLQDETSRVDGLNTILQNLNLTTTDLQEHIMQTRMQPIGTVFSRFRRVVRDLSQQLGKKIDLEIIGEDVELDKSLVESLSDPLTHLIRNCCDHGIEMPDARQQSGKEESGKIVLHAFHEGGQINIRIQDDGRGIDPERVGQKALQQGLITQSDLDRMSPKELTNLILLPGFSTADQVSEISGRGVGMDVVRTNIEKLGGHISIESQKGSGTTILLRLPLTLAIIPSLIVGVSQYRFAIPQLNLVELHWLQRHEINQRIERVGTADVLRLRGKLLPLVRLGDMLGIPRTYPDPANGEPQPDRRERVSDRRFRPEHPELETQASSSGGEFVERGQDRREEVGQDFYIAILNMGGNEYGLIVDHVHDLEEIVVKPLSSYLKHCPCFTAATIMGDGRVAMILDVSGIAHAARLSFTDLQAESRRREEVMVERRSDREHFDVILFNSSADEVFAVPLDSVLRLEKFQAADIQRVRQREFLNYRGKGLPIIRLDSVLPVRSLPDPFEEAYLIIPKVGDCEAGIIASQILDTVSVDVKLQDLMGGNHNGLLGSAVVEGRMTLFIDPALILDRAGVVISPALAAS